MGFRVSDFGSQGTFRGVIFFLFFGREGGGGGSWGFRVSSLAFRVAGLSGCCRAFWRL